MNSGLGDLEIRAGVGDVWDSWPQECMSGTGDPALMCPLLSATFSFLLCGQLSTPTLDSYLISASRVSPLPHPNASPCQDLGSWLRGSLLDRAHLFFCKPRRSSASAPCAHVAWKERAREPCGRQIVPLLFGMWAGPIPLDWTFDRPIR